MAYMTTTQAQAIKILVIALMTAPLFILLALFFVLGTGEQGSGGLTVAAGALIVGFFALGAHIAAGLLHSKLEPLDPNVREDRSRVVGERFQANLMTRFALCEAPIMVSVALAFVASGHTILIALLGVVLGEALLARHVWPNSWNLTKAQTQLESKGVPSQLLESFGKQASY
jgi:hypothetical protein